MKIILVLLGGAIGTGCRFGLTNLVAMIWREPPKYPYSTFIANITGCFLIGLLAELFEARMPVSAEIRAAILVGILGGYTTFSSFSFETLSFIRDDQYGIAMFYSLGSVAVGLMATWLGVQLARLG
ncbi:MAG: fluoride efflux transporter CrcB [Blastocatellales bacterium]